MKIEVGYVQCKIVSEISESIFNQLREELKYANDKANRFVKSKNKKYQIADFKYLLHKGRKTFPTGCLSRVLKVLETNEITPELVDSRIDDIEKNPELKLTSYILRDYQEEARQACLENKTGIVRIATGGGKTAIFTALASDLQKGGVVIFVRRQLLMYQTIGVLERELGMEIGQVGAGNIDIKQITVAMIPTVARAVDSKYKFSRSNSDDDNDNTKLTAQHKQDIKKYMESCKTIIIDECHCLGADTAQIVAGAAKNAVFRLGFSASPWRDDGKDILLEAVTGNRIIDIDASYLIDRGFLVQPHIYFFKTPPVNLAISSQGTYQDVYRSYIVENTSRNELILDKAIEAYNRFEKVLILVQQVDHGEYFLERLLEEAVWAEYINGGKPLKSREDVMTRFSSFTRCVLIGTNQTLGEGIDLPGITVMINASGGKSSVMYYQKIGRCIRTNGEDKKRAIVIDFLDKNIKFMNKHAKARLSLIKTESLYKLKLQDK